LPAYVGVPMIQDKLKQQQQAMAMQQPQQQPPIADQIMAASAPRRMPRREVMPQENQVESEVAQAPVQGITAAPSNLPEMSAAEGGILGYAAGGNIEQDERDEEDEDDEDARLYGSLPSRMYGTGSENDFVQSIMPASGGYSVHPSAAVEMRSEPSSFGIKSSHKYANLVAEEAKKQGRDPGLYLAILDKETGGIKNPEAVRSKSGAIGIAQFMPKTAKQYGIDPTIPEEAAYGLVKHASYLQDKYKDPKIAMAAYNWGEGNVNKWLKAGADPKKLPQETRQYANLAEGGLAEIAHYYPGGPVVTDFGDVATTRAGTPLETPSGVTVDEFGDPIKPSRIEPPIYPRQTAQQILQGRNMPAGPQNPFASSAATAAPEAAEEGTLAMRGIKALGKNVLRPAASLPGAVVIGGGELASRGARGVMASPMNAANRQALESNSMLGAMSGDDALASAIYDATKDNQPASSSVTTPAKKEQPKPTAKADESSKSISSPEQVDTIKYGLDNTGTQEQGITQLSPADRYAQMMEQSLLDDAASSKKNHEVNKYLALMQAGFGMMGGTSPYAAVNIGQGAQQGIGAYANLAKTEQEDRKTTASTMASLYRNAAAREYHDALVGGKVTPQQKAIQTAEAQYQRQVIDLDKDQAAAEKMAGGQLSPSQLQQYAARKEALRKGIYDQLAPGQYKPVQIPAIKADMPERKIGTFEGITMSSKDKQAIEWANQNRTNADPTTRSQAEAILKKWQTQ